MKKPSQKDFDEIFNGARKPTKSELEWAIHILKTTDWKFTKKTI